MLLQPVQQQKIMALVKYNLKKKSELFLTKNKTKHFIKLPIYVKYNINTLALNCQEIDKINYEEEEKVTPSLQ